MTMAEMVTKTVNMIELALIPKEEIREYIYDIMDAQESEQDESKK